jgi:hypothetical protein
MSNKSKKIAGIIILVVLVVVGIALKLKNHNSSGWTLIILGCLGLIGILVDWVHNQFKMPGAKKLNR